ncbi:hypothetical protein V6N12_019338 [Hibiscus sabdariffa]|uniref:Uncharacterized protein n=1 Tax=Hibiscus sabdariffa TaxID=183260 RepID=A0ABR2AQQ5_9ROSI
MGLYQSGGSPHLVDSTVSGFHVEQEAESAVSSEDFGGNRLSWLPSTWFFELIPLIWSMTVLAWNVRGMGNKDTIRALRNSIQKFQSNIVFLSETKQKKRYLEKIKMKMKFTHCHYEDPCGLAWGLALWWSDDTQITILRSGKHFIDAMSSINGDRSGDSNVVSCQEEKLGGLLLTQMRRKPTLNSLIIWLSLIYLFLESARYPKAVGVLDVAIGSDHAPIIILPQGFKKKYRKDFKFESKWLLEEDCTSTIQTSWQPTSQPRPSHRFGSKLRRTKFSLIKWSKMKTRVNNQRKQQLMERINSYQGKQLSKAELSETMACKKELDSMWEREESLFKEDQRSWDEGNIENLFPPDIVRAIMTISIGGPTVKDSIIWVAAKDGVYSVRSGYRFC